MPLLVSTNDVYWQYHEVAVRVRLSNGRPMYMGAALKGNDLYLVRVEGSINGAGMLHVLGRKKTLYGNSTT